MSVPKVNFTNKRSLFVVLKHFFKWKRPILIVFNASEFRFSPFLEIILMTQWVNIKGQGYFIQFL